MPTLRNFDGRSLVPDHSQGLNNLLRSTVFGIQRADALDAHIKQEQGQVSTLREQVNNAQTPAQREAALVRLSTINPNIANSIRATLKREDNNALIEIQREAEKGLRQALLIKKLPTHLVRVREITRMAEQEAVSGNPDARENINRMAELANLSEDQLNLELEKMIIQGTDIAILTKPYR